MSKYGGVSPTAEESKASVDHVFDQFVTAVTCKSILSSFHQLLDCTGLRHADQAHFYNALKGKLAGSWKAQALWSKIDKRAAHRDYKHKRGQACKNMRVLVIGAGPCGLRTAIECTLLGARTVVLEKRDRFSRNNVLHLWPYLITDLRNLGAKKFFGKFCAGSIDHISIRQIQCILLKVALLLGVEVHVNVAFEGLVEPQSENGLGWRCNVSPECHAVSEFVFDVLIGADGKRNTLPGFSRKEFRGKLAIAITANFINRNSQAEARVEEISGVAFIFNQKFFLDLKEKTRIDLENIVYYKDDTHYFVMTAKKASLLEKGVLKEDYGDTQALLDRSNVNQEALLAYAREAANFSTNYQLPSLDYAVNHYGQADVAMFDFTSMFAAEHASRFILKNGHHLLMGLVGDSLLEPFWPTGSGCARGFLGAFDAAWMIRSWASGKMTPLQVLAERESIYTVLSQTTPNYLHKNYNLYSLDPNTRYPNLNLKAVKPNQLRHLYEGGNFTNLEVEEEEVNVAVPTKKLRNNEEIDSYSLLRWCQRVLNTGKYRNVHVVDFTSSWRSGLALCALIHSFRPEIINFTQLMECDIAENNQLAFNVAEKELGISPVMCGADMAKYEIPDKLTMVAYLSQFYQLFRQDVLPSAMPHPVRAKRKSTTKDNDPKSPRSPSRRISFLQKLSARLAKSKKRKEQEINEASPLSSKKMKDFPEGKSDVDLISYNKLPMEEIANRLQVNRPSTQVKLAKTEEMTGAVSVTAMAEVLSAKFKDLEEKPAPEPIRRMKGQPSLLAAAPASEFCSFCHKRVYIMERMSAEGEFFHRGCFKCDHCYVGLRLNNYSFERDARNRVKFYCYRHALPELRLRPRKRGLEEEIKENVPETVIHPPPEDDTQRASKEKSPRKTAPAHLSPLTLPQDVHEKPHKTPERVEFEISFDGQEEESEEEQFEHNLRASQSSDTLLDEDDSDSDSSDLDEGSGAEDDVWESAGEGLSPPALPLTLEEACEFVDTWHRTHSTADGSLERERNAGRRYHRLGDEEEDEEEDEEGDGSSTEIGDSEFETDDSSAEEEEEESSIKVPSQLSKISSIEGVTPTSPSSRLSASKANFFSEPPTVVSLDPWSMFGIGSKSKNEEKEEDKHADEEMEEERSKTKDKSETNSKRDEELSGQDNTDVSENLEYEWKPEDALKEEDRRERFVSKDDSLDDLSGDLNQEDGEVFVTSKDVRNELGENEAREIDSDGEKDFELGGEGDDEGDDDIDEDELMEKTAVSQAMEQLLKDFDHKNVKKESVSDERFLNVSSDSGDNDKFVEGRNSPSASKARKFRMKRNARQVKGKRSKSSHLSITSESEAARTDPTTTDNSQTRSSISRSPSADIEVSGEAHSITAAETLAVKEVESKKSEDEIQVEDKVEEDKIIADGEQETEKNASDQPNERLMDTDIMDIEIGTQSAADDTLRHVLENVAAMPDLSEPEDLDDLVFANIDDRFVTDRRKRNSKPPKPKPRNKEEVVEDDKQVLEGKVKERDGNDSSFSISTPSESETSVSSLDEFAGLIKDMEHVEDDEAPDDELLKDYQTTMSIALGEAYSDDEQEAQEDDAKDLITEKDDDSEVNKKDDEAAVELRRGKEDETSGGNEKMDDVKERKDLETGTTHAEPAEHLEDEKGDVEMERDISETLRSTNSSIYGTPEVNLDQRHSILKGFHDSTPSSPTEVGKPASLHERRLSEVQYSDVKRHSSNSAIVSPYSEFPRKLVNARESSGSEIFLSPMESFTSPPLANAKSVPQLSPSKGDEIPLAEKTRQSRASVDSSSTHPLPPPTSSSSLTSMPAPAISSSSSSSNKSSKVITTTPRIPSAKIQRKLPELPKLKMPSMQAVKAVKGGNLNNSAKEPSKQMTAKSEASQGKRGVQTKKVIKPNTLSNQMNQDGFDPPVLCSSPKLTAKSKSGAPKITSNGRVLPMPNISSSSSSTSTRTASKSTPSVNSSVTALPSSSPPPPSSSKPTKKPNSSTSTSNPKPAPFKPVKLVSQDKAFTKPISPPVFRPPAKTKITVDKNKLQLGSSGDSESDVTTLKKKISAEGVSVGNEIEDIPFADEGEESETKFYTPCAPDKLQKPLTSHSENNSPGLQARKRILPSPPSKRTEPAVLTSDQIREIRKADMEKAKFQARERARLKSDEELGISTTETPTKVLSRNHVNNVKNENRRSASFDTLSASDILSDSDDKLSSPVQSPMSSAAEPEPADGTNNTKANKKKFKGGQFRKARKGKKEKEKEKDSDLEKKDKRKSLLALILPGKTSDKSPKFSDSTSTDTPKGSDNDHSKSKGKKDKSKHKGKTDTKDELDHAPVSEYKKDLAICSVFHSNTASHPKMRLSSLTKRDSHIAPKASIDELSDSDESHVSMSTMRRMDDDLDERVARRLRKIQLKQQRQAQQKRLRMAQEIQRQLEEVEVRQRELEERGTSVEKILRGDGPDEDVDEASLMNEWFSLVHEKNALLRYESELNVRAKELELEDRHARLESEFRDRSRKPEENKTENDIRMEGLLLDELLDVVKQRDSLVAMLEEDRLREKKEDKELQDMMKHKGYVLSPLSYDTRRERDVTAPLASPVL